ncbi:MAG: PHP domain-containing protein [Marinilabiliales bacterium]|nr:PHP domain-containing protein [Marinilabiliales bacterium]
MKRYRADLHLHTVLSACAELEMSPAAIVTTARQRGLDMIAITDHNSTLQTKVVKELGEEVGLTVICGVEVTTREEVHCLAYFGEEERLDQFQAFIDQHLPILPLLPGSYQYQAVVDKSDGIVRLIDNFLNVGLQKSIDEIEAEVHRLGGLFVPAHVERPLFGLYSQLGLLPDGLQCDGMGIMWRSTAADIRNRFRIPAGLPLMRASDAHSLEEIGLGYTELEMESCTFDEFRQALQGIGGRSVCCD